MQSPEPPQAFLLLEDGTFYKGKAVGKIGTATGELCFNTGMTGYQEIFTDPSYYGQILITTNVHIGNYGVKDSETESDRIQISGLICKSFSDHYSRVTGDGDLHGYFQREGVVAISDVDTRELVRKVRTKGAMNCIISSEILDINKLRSSLRKVPSMEGLELASEVSTKTAYELGDPSSDHRVAILDYGIKKSILKCLIKRSCFLKVFPCATSFEEMEDWKPDGYFLSNGPGDPAAMDYAVQTVKKILECGTPLFGICLGHQLLALGLDIPTYKMHHGHRGINHPVKNLLTGLCEVTSQNHGFGVRPEAIAEKPDEVMITHINLNDQTVEGIKLLTHKAFSVQYHPEASPGPHDSRYLFDNFFELISNHKLKHQTAKSYE